MRRLTPQEKKLLSLANDRRNSYGENDKSSRKNIPRAKARVNRVNRRADAMRLADAVGVPDYALDTATDDAVKGRRREVWRKVADIALGQKLARREGAEDPRSFDPSRTGWH